MTVVKRWIIVVALLVLGLAAAAFVYQTAARERDYRTLLARGDLALRNEQTFSAIEAYSGAIALRPDSMLAYLRRAETYERRGDRGDLDQAARDFRRAASLDPAATRPLEELGDVLYQLRRYPQALESYSAFLRIDDRSPRVSYKLALAAYASRDLDLAVSTLNQTLHLNERLPDAQYLLGLALRDRRQDAAALRAFERAVQLAPGSIPAREELADAYNASGHLRDELEQLQALAALDRDHVERRVAVALAQARASHADLAVATLGSALDPARDEPVIYAALGQIWLDLSLARNDAVDRGKALAALSRAATSSGATSAMLTLYGRALLADRQNEMAERVLQEATSRYPLDPGALWWYATAAERQNHLTAARAALVDYAALVGDDVELGLRATRIAAVSLKLNDAATAVTWLARAAEVNPTDMRLIPPLVEAQLKLGDRRAARATIDKALEKEPTNSVVLELSRRVR
jgi:tetratricopeptide (TPR) repeat protein